MVWCADPDTIVDRRACEADVDAVLVAVAGVRVNYLPHRGGLGHLQLHGRCCCRSTTAGRHLCGPYHQHPWGICKRHWERGS